jgi:hypothetical protein
MNNASLPYDITGAQHITQTNGALEVSHGARGLASAAAWARTTSTSRAALQTQDLDRALNAFWTQSYTARVAWPHVMGSGRVSRPTTRVTLTHGAPARRAICACAVTAR